MMIIILILIYFMLSLTAGGERTAKTIVTISLNCLLLALAILLISTNVPVIPVAVVLFTGISLITIFFQNETNDKTKAAFLSVMMIILVFTAIIVFFVYKAHLQGMSIMPGAKIRESNGYSGDINVNMVMIQITVMVLILTGSVTDAAVSISSGIYEVLRRNPDTDVSGLFRSGMNIGADILNSNVNTLFFIMLGESMIMFINYMQYHSFAALINSKEFSQETISIALSAFACVLAIPVTSAVCAAFFKRKAGRSGKRPEKA